MDKRYEKLVRAVEAGETLSDAGRKIGVSAKTACRMLRSLGDGVERRRRRTLTSREMMQIVRLSDRGVESVREIARRMERSWHAVRAVLDARRIVRIVKPHRCQTCGALIQTQYCVYCRAMGRDDA